MKVLKSYSREVMKKCVAEDDAFVLCCEGTNQDERDGNDRLINC